MLSLCYATDSCSWSDSSRTLYEDKHMSSLHAAPLLLAILIGPLLGIVAWGVLSARGSNRVDDTLPDTPSNDTFLGVLVLAAFAMGVFLTYALLSFK